MGAVGGVVPFAFDGAQVRVMTIDGEPWFVARDVASVLGYADTDYAIRAHCKGAQTYAGDSSGQVRHFKIIPERDMYRLVMRSRLPAAERFEEWVVGEVLPSIRKTGAYVAPAAAPAIASPGSLQLARQMLEALEQQAHELAIARAAQEQQAAQLEEIERRVDDIGLRSALVTVLDERPAGTESLTRATERAWATFGLPTEIAKFALTESEHQIAPMHEVKNRHVPDAPPYKVYQRAQVTAAIRKFIAECRLVSRCVAEHWAYAAPFRINPTVFPTPRAA